MEPLGYVIVGALSLMLLGVIYWLWRYWDEAVRRTPEQEAYDKRMARLNERQSNRLSDDQLRGVIDEESAWNIMVSRGRRTADRGRRYGGELRRRQQEERPARQRTRRRR